MFYHAIVTILGFAFLGFLLWVWVKTHKGGKK